MVGHARDAAADVPPSAVLSRYARMPLHVFELLYRPADAGLPGGRDARFGIVLIARGSEVGGGDERSALGTRGVVTEAAEFPDGRWVLEVEGEALIRWRSGSPTIPIRWRWSESRTRAGSGRRRPAGGRRRTAGAPGAGPAGGAGGCAASPARAALDGGGDADRAAWQLCAVAPLSAYDAQRLLGSDGAPERLRLLSALMEELELDLHRMLGAE